MKNYVKPSIELNRFDVEDIITVSGQIGTMETLSADTKTVYEAYVADNTPASAVVEFHW